jgi:hypothetical protein
LISERIENTVLAGRGAEIGGWSGQSLRSYLKNKLKQKGPGAWLKWYSKESLGSNPNVEEDDIHPQPLVFNLYSPR